MLPGLVFGSMCKQKYNPIRLQLKWKNIISKNTIESVRGASILGTMTVGCLFFIITYATSLQNLTTCIIKTWFRSSVAERRILNSCRRGFDSPRNLHLTYHLIM